MGYNLDELDETIHLLNLNKARLAEWSPDNPVTNYEILDRKVVEMGGQPFAATLQVYLREDDVFIYPTVNGESVSVGLFDHDTQMGADLAARGYYNEVMSHPLAHSGPADFGAWGPVVRDLLQYGEQTGIFDRVPYRWRPLGAQELAGMPERDRIEIFQVVGLMEEENNVPDAARVMEYEFGCFLPKRNAGYKAVAERHSFLYEREMRQKELASQSAILEKVDCSFAARNAEWEAMNSRELIQCGADIVTANHVHHCLHRCPGHKLERLAAFRDPLGMMLEEIKAMDPYNGALNIAFPQDPDADTFVEYFLDKFADDPDLKEKYELEPAYESLERVDWGVSLAGSQAQTQAKIAHPHTSGSPIRLRDLLLLEIQDSVYLSHIEGDGFALIGGITIDNFPPAAKERFHELLDAEVKAIHRGAYGVEVELDGISPDIIEDFDRAHAEYFHGGGDAPCFQDM